MDELFSISIFDTTEEVVGVVEADMSLSYANARLRALGGEGASAFGATVAAEDRHRLQTLIQEALRDGRSFDDRFRRADSAGSIGIRGIALRRTRAVPFSLLLIAGSTASLRTPSLVGSDRPEHLDPPGNSSQQLVLDNLDIIAFELDAAGRFLLSRGKGLRKLGLLPDQLVGQSIYDIYKDQPSILEGLKRALSGANPSIEVEVQGIVWHANFVPIRNAAGKIERVFGTAMDITERKHAEEALRTETHLWHTLMNNIPDTIFFKDIQSRFTRVNKAQADILGISDAAQAIGKTEAEFLPEAFARQSLLDEQQILTTGLPLQGKLERLTGDDGKTRWFSTTKVPIRSPEGGIVGIVGSSREITELKQAEALESALSRIAAETSSSGDMGKFYAAIHRIIGELMYAKNFYIALHDPANGLLTYPYYVDEFDPPPSPEPLGKGLTTYVLRSGQSLLCDERRLAELRRLGQLDVVGAPSPIWLGVPLIAEKKTIGVMVVQHYSDPRAFTEREQHILEFVSSQVARAIVYKRAEEALRASQAELVALFASMNDAIIVFDDEGRYLKIAPTNPSLLFRPPGELVGKTLQEVFPPERAESFLAAIRRALRDGSAAIEYPLEINNRVCWFAAVISRMDPRTVVWVARDVTEGKRSEEIIQQSELKYRTIFEESQDGIVISTPGGKLLDVNQATVQLLGYGSKEELLQVEHARNLYYDPTDRERFMTAILAQGTVRDFEFILLRKDGHKRVVLENASLVRDERGAPSHIRAFLRDISERKRLEEQLRQAQKMEGIGTLAGGIAHDFNNILNIILGYAMILETSAQDAARAEESVKTIKLAVQRGADLVKQLLTFARRSNPAFESVNVTDMVVEISTMLSQTFPPTIAIELDVAGSIPIIVADSTQLHQAVLNLCVNARDAINHTSAGGTGTGVLALSTRMIPGPELRARFPEASGEQFVAIGVRDNGIGMDDATRSRIFEPFFTTKELGKGTGLGLAVVYGVINSHHGFIDVESASGKGTTFTLYFPVPAELVLRDAPAPPARAPEPQLGHETILVVEDEEMLATLLKGILEDRGYKVLMAKDGKEGLELYERHQAEIALILSDMGLPKLGGWEMFQEMKKVNADVKAILASGYFDPNLKFDLIKAGAKDFIQKPYVADLILQRIREVIDSQ